MQMEEVASVQRQIFTPIQWSLAGDLIGSFKYFPSLGITFAILRKMFGGLKLPSRLYIFEKSSVLDSSENLKQLCGKRLKMSPWTDSLFFVTCLKRRFAWINRYITHAVCFSIPFGGGSKPQNPESLQVRKTTVGFFPPQPSQKEFLGVWLTPIWLVKKGSPPKRFGRNKNVSKTGGSLRVSFWLTFISRPARFFPATPGAAEGFCALNFAKSCGVSQWETRKGDVDKQDRSCKSCESIFFSEKTWYHHHIRRYIYLTKLCWFIVGSSFFFSNYNVVDWALFKKNFEALARARGWGMGSHLQVRCGSFIRSIPNSNRLLSSLTFE